MWCALYFLDAVGLCLIAILNALEAFNLYKIWWTADKGYEPTISSIGKFILLGVVSTLCAVVSMAYTYVWVQEITGV